MGVKIMLHKLADDRVCDEIMDFEEKARLKKMSPELVGSVLGYKFYEDPEDGDEVPLIVEDKSGNWGWSYWYELPEVYEIE